MADEYAELIEAIAAAHKRGHLLALACAVEQDRNRLSMDIIGEGDVLASLADHIRKALNSKTGGAKLN